MIAMTVRITQLGISRWTDKGGSYRTVQRFFHTEIDWLAVKWRFFTLFVYDPIFRPLRRFLRLRYTRDRLFIRSGGDG